MKIPSYKVLMNPTLRALDNLGGSGTIKEINSEALKILDLPEEIASRLHKPNESSDTEVEYRLGWARTYLKKVELLTNSVRGVWAFTKIYQKGQEVDPEKVVQKVLALQGNKYAKKRKALATTTPPESTESAEEEPNVPELDLEDSWTDGLLQNIAKLDFDSFERLLKRVLRESGFVQVDITERDQSGRLEGKGVLKLQNLISFHVAFRCERHQGKVGAGDIREFRGNAVGRAEKFLFVTNGAFTPDAVAEATRDGAPIIDLMDGHGLAETLKNLNLGVKTQTVERVEIDDEWFESV
ncbi:MAG: restriction endonuclease [Deltaproteobacteria bacterium]|jgi:restriction system protein|nr:restriction endonuclease [Deltaproteobacteria bacterium]